MKNQYKSYPSIPPGKKLIFRWSFIDPQTGAKIVARNRPFPMLVDDVPEQRARPRSAKGRMAKPVQRPRPVAVLTSKPVQWPQAALTVQHPRPVQPPHMSAVTVVPAPTQPSKPHPGTHGDALNVIGAFAGGTRAARQAPTGQSEGSTFLEVLGGALGGAGATYVSAGIGQAMPKEHNTITDDLAEKAEAHGAEFAQQLRKLADELDECAAAEAGPNGNGLAQVGFLLLEGLMRIGAGMVNGAPAGARAHLTLVNPTDKNVQKLVSNI
ncbi:hypothetical protein ACN28I_34780 [Archangium gephyra]|uniref:hypothetical protein n=1 Tax=Archangium gephyra TaxID=48 RepID=UPI003B7ABC56